MSWPALLSSFHPAFFSPAILSLTFGCRSEVSVNRNYGFQGTYLLGCACAQCCWRQSKIFLEDQRLPVVRSVSKKDFIYIMSLHLSDLFLSWGTAHSLPSKQYMSWIIHLFHSNEWKAFHQPQWGLTQSLRAWCIYSFLQWVVLHFGCSHSVLANSLCHLFLSSVTGLFLFQPHGLEAQPASEAEWGGRSILAGFQYGPFWS